MACKEGECVLNRIYPNSNAILACDTDCHLSENKGMVEAYKKKFPEEMKYYK